MTCDDLRKSAMEGAPLDDDARAHLAGCAACGAEFAGLRALTTFRPAAPDSLRDKVLAAAFPVRKASPWKGLRRAAAVFIIGAAGGFVGGYAVRPERVREVEVVKKEFVTPPVPDDYVSNVGIAADGIYGKGRLGARRLVEVNFVPNSIRIRSIVVDPKMKDIERHCPVARQLGSLASKRSDVVVYREIAGKKKEY